jgi:GAF domain-containing protein
LADYDLLLQALRNFASAMGMSYDIIEMSYQLGDRVTEALEVVGVGVSVADRDGNLKFVTASNEQIVALGEFQEKNQVGPCVAAFANQEPVIVEDIEEADYWPGYKEIATELGLRAAVGYPLSYNGARLGALNVYAAEPRKWKDDDIDVLGVFADMATAYLVRTAELAESRELANQLHGALDSRVLIEQAKGVLANEHGISVDEAFGRLRRHSQNRNMKLVEVCRQVVNDGLRIPEAK